MQSISQDPSYKIMKAPRTPWRVGVCSIIAILCHHARPATANLTVGQNDLARVSVYFEENVGQVDSQIQFLVHCGNAKLLLTGDAVWLGLLSRRPSSDGAGWVRLGLAASNPNAEPEGVNPLPGYVNYFVGNDPACWRTNVPAFGQVKYKSIYPGVDLIYHGNQQQLESDFRVEPGADPSRIALEFGEGEKISIGPEGHLLLEMPAGSVRLCKPVAYQETAGARVYIPAKFSIRSDGRVGFELGDYDHAKTLVIDPVLAYSVILGGSGGPSQGLAIALDTNDNVYLTGSTSAPGFPVAGGLQTSFTGSQDVFITEFASNGSMVFSTFLGGNGAQSGQGIAVDANGNIFVAGYTSSTNFPTQNALQATNGGGYDAFVTKLSPGGKSLIYSTYLGGNGFDAANAIALDTNDSAIVTGYTQSTNFPTANAAQPINGGNGDAFVAKLNSQGASLSYSTYLGGSDSENNNVSTDIDPAANLGDLVAHLGGALAVDIDGNAYLTGWTYSTNFPVFKAFQATNAVSSPGSYSTPFVAKLDTSGNIVFSTYFGGAYSDTSRAISLDFSNNIYFAGSWWGYDLPATNGFTTSFSGSYGFNGVNGATGDGFIAALDHTGTNLIFATYFGGSGDEQINSMAVRPDGAVAVTGWTDSPNLPFSFLPIGKPIQGDSEQGCFKSTSGGNAWTASSSGLAPFPIFTIGVDPFDPANVYVINSGGLFQSTNSGVGWTRINFNVSSPAIVGSSQELLAFDPLRPGLIYAGSYSDVFKTTNGGAAWISTSSGLPAPPQIQALAVDPATPNTLYASTESIGVSGLYQSTNGGNSWFALKTGLGGFTYITALLVDPLNSSNVYAGVTFNPFGSSLIKSTDRGGTWNPVNTLPAFGQGVVAIASDRVNLENIYVLMGGGGSSAALCLTTNGGATWAEPLEATNQNLTAVAVAPPLTPALALTHSGTNASISWPAAFAGYVLQTTPGLSPAQWQNLGQAPQVIGGYNVAALPISSSDGFYRLAYTNSAARQPTFYVGTDRAGSQGLLRSSDGGNTWQAFGLSGQTVNALAVSPGAPSTIYAGLAGSYDAFVATFSPPSPNRFLYFSTYLGGSGADQGNAIIVDSRNAFVAGSSLSPDFPTTSGQNLGPHALDLTKLAQGLTPADAVYFYLAGAFPCPTNHTFILNLTNGVAFASEQVYLNLAPYTESGVLPPGVELGSYNGYYQFGGKPNSTGSLPQTNTYTFTYTEGTTPDGGKCTWTITFNIIVYP
jgi:hypothetical protein